PTLQHNCEAKETGQLRHAIGTAGLLCVKNRATSNWHLYRSIDAPGEGDGRVRDHSWPPTASHRQRPHELWRAATDPFGRRRRRDPAIKLSPSCNSMRCRPFGAAVSLSCLSSVCVSLSYACACHQQTLHQASQQRTACVRPGQVSRSRRQEAAIAAAPSLCAHCPLCWL